MIFQYKTSGVREEERIMIKLAVLQKTYQYYNVGITFVLV